MGPISSIAMTSHFSNGVHDGFCANVVEVWKVYMILANLRTILLVDMR